MTDAPRSTKQLEHLIQDPELFDVGVEYSAIRDILLEVVSKVNELSNSKSFKVSTPVVEVNNSEEVKQLTQQINQFQEDSKQQYSEFSNEIRELKAFFSFQLKDIREKYDRHINRLTNSISNPETSRLNSEPQIEYITDEDKVEQLSRQVDILTSRFDNFMKTVDSSKLQTGNTSSRQQDKKQSTKTPEKIQPITLGGSDKSESVNTSIPKMDLNLSKKEINEIGDLTEEVPLSIPEKPISQPVSPVLKPIIDITRKEVKKDPRVDDLVLQVRSIIDELKNGSEKTKKMITTINSLIKEFERQSSEVSSLKLQIENKNDEFDRIYDKMAGISVDAQKTLQDKYDELLSSRKDVEGSNSNNAIQSNGDGSSNNQDTINQATITALESLKNSFIHNFEKLDSNYRPQISYLKQEVNQLKNQVKSLGGSIEEISAPKMDSPAPQIDIQIPDTTKTDDSKNNSSTENNSDKNDSTKRSFSMVSVQTLEGWKDVPTRRFNTATPNGSSPNMIDIFDLVSLENTKTEGSNDSKVTSVTSKDNHKVIPNDDLILGTPADSVHVSSISTVRDNSMRPRTSNGNSEFSFEHILSLTIISNDIQQTIIDAVREQFNSERLKELSKVETEKPPSTDFDVSSIMKQISDLKNLQSSGNQQSQEDDKSGLIIATSIVEKFKPIIDSHETRIAALQKHIEVLQDQQDQSKKEIQQIRNQQKAIQTPPIIKNRHPTIVSPRPSTKKFNLNTTKSTGQKKKEEKQQPEQTQNQTQNQTQKEENHDENKNPPFSYDPLDLPSRPRTSGDGKGRKDSKITLNVIHDGNDNDEDDNVVYLTESDLKKIKIKIHNIEKAYESLSKKVSDLQINSSQTAQSPHSNEANISDEANKKVESEKSPVKEKKEIKRSLSTISIPPVPKKLDMMDKITPNFKSHVEVKNVDEELEVAIQNLSRPGSVQGSASMPLFDVVERERALQQQILEDQGTQNDKKGTSHGTRVRIDLPSSNSSRAISGSAHNINSSRTDLNSVNLTEQIESVVAAKFKDYKIYSEDQFRIIRKHIQNIINDLDLLKAPVQGMIVLPNSDADFNQNNSNNNKSEINENAIKSLKKNFELRTNDLEDQINDLRLEILQFLQKLSTQTMNPAESSRSKDGQNNSESASESSRKNQDSKKNQDKNKNKNENQKKPADKPISLERSESFLRLKKKFMEEINSPRMLKTTHYTSLDAPEPISDGKKRLIVENRANESENYLNSKENQIHKSMSTSNKSATTSNENPKPKGKISSSLSDPSIVLQLDKKLINSINGEVDEESGLITYEMNDKYRKELRRFWGRRVPQSIHEFNVRNAEPVKEVIETLVLPYIIEMRSEFQIKVDKALEQSRLSEEMILNKVDKDFVNDFFRKMRMTIVELKTQIDEVKNSVPDKVSHEELQNLATDLYKSVTKDQTTTVGTKSYRCLFCGAPKQNVSGMITDKNVVEALGDPQQARASQNPTMIFGSDKQCYKGRGNYGRTGIASKIESRKIPPLRATTAVSPKE